MRTVLSEPAESCPLQEVRRCSVDIIVVGMEEAGAHRPLGAGAGADEDPPRPCSLPSCGQIPPTRLNDISPT